MRETTKHIQIQIQIYTYTRTYSYVYRTESSKKTTMDLIHLLFSLSIFLHIVRISYLITNPPWSIGDSTHLFANHQSWSKISDGRNFPDNEVMLQIQSLHNEKKHFEFSSCFGVIFGRRIKFFLNVRSHGARTRNFDSSMPGY